VGLDNGRLSSLFLELAKNNPEPQSPPFCRTRGQTKEWTKIKKKEISGCGCECCEAKEMMIDDSSLLGRRSTSSYFKQTTNTVNRLYYNGTKK
jgi:hypothetical protein